MVSRLRAAVLQFSLIALAAKGTEAYGAEIKAETLEGGTVVFWISGEIESGDEVAFRRLSVEHSDAIVLLNSNGGKLMPAIEIGKIIRLAGYPTVVGDDFTCSSSCALIWLAGAPRYLEPKGRVGFHASYRNKEGKLEETGVGNAVIGHYLSLLNLPQRAVVFATTASPNDITWLTNENSRLSGIDFKTFGSEADVQSEVRADPTPKAASNPPVIRTVTPPPPIQRVATPPPLVKTVTRPQIVSERPISDYSLDDFKVMFRSAFRDKEYLRRNFAFSELSADSVEALLSHSSILYSDNAYIDRVAYEIYQARFGFSGGESDRAIAMSIGQATNIKLTLNGLSRVSDRDVKLYLTYLTAMINRATPAECKAILTGKDEFGKAELRILSELGSQNFIEYLALTRRAIAAELANTPFKIVPTKVESDAGQKSFDNFLTQQLGRLSKTEQDRINAAIAALSEANDKDSCDAHYAIFKAAIDLGGMPGNWQRRTLVNSLAE